MTPGVAVAWPVECKWAGGQRVVALEVCVIAAPPSIRGVRAA